MFHRVLPIHVNRIFLAALIFTAAYLISFSTHAEDTSIIVGPGDSIQVGHNNNALITGKITEVGSGVMVVESAGKRMKIDLSDVDMDAAASTLFQPGMPVTIDGEIDGDDFGVPVVKARSVTASEMPTAVITDQTDIR